MKYFIGLLLGLFALIGLPSCESNKRANNYNNKALVDDSGMLFLKNGAEASLATVKASGLAISNSKNQQVIQFAKAMIDDHTLLADNLRKLEIDNFVTSNDTINAAHQQVIAALAQKKAAEFDKAYMELLVTQHEQELALFKTAGLNKNLNVSDFARKAVPSLQAHLDSAKMIMMALK
jgi:putative membrane protein